MSDGPYGRHGFSSNTNAGYGGGVPPAPSSGGYAAPAYGQPSAPGGAGAPGGGYAAPSYGAGGGGGGSYGYGSYGGGGAPDSYGQVRDGVFNFCSFFVFP